MDGATLIVPGNSADQGRGEGALSAGIGAPVPAHHGLHGPEPATSPPPRPSPGGESFNADYRDAL